MSWSFYVIFGPGHLCLRIRICEGCEWVLACFGFCMSLDDFAVGIELVQFTLGNRFRCFVNIGSGCICSFNFGLRWILQLADTATTVGNSLKPLVQKKQLGGHWEALKAMALSLREIYRKLRKALEDVLSRDALPIVSDRFQPIFTEVGKMCLREEDIVSIEDFAVMVAFRLNVMNGGMRIPHYDPELQLFVCENLLRLLRPVENGLLPPQGPTTLRIWEVFANANAQQRQFCILAVFVLCLGAPLPVILLKSNPMVVEIQRKFDGLLASFQQVRVLLEKQALLTPELQRLMKDFESRLSSCCQGMIPRILRKDRAACPDQQEFSELTMRWARLSAQASEIAVEVAKLPSIEASIADTIEVTSLDLEHRLREKCRAQGCRGCECSVSTISWQPDVVPVWAWWTTLLFAVPPLQTISVGWRVASGFGFGAGRRISNWHFFDVTFHSAMSCFCWCHASIWSITNHVH